MDPHKMSKYEDEIQKTGVYVCDRTARNSLALKHINGRLKVLLLQCKDATIK